MWFTEPECFQADQLAALVTHATGGDLHIVLAPQAVWRSDQARAAANQAIAELYARYAGQPEDREEPNFKAIAELLSRPPEARYGWIRDKHSGTKLSVLVAGSSWFGLIAVRDGADVWVRTFRPDRLSAVLADVLPEDAWRTSVPSIRVLRSEMLAAKNPGNGAVPRPEVRRAQRFAALTPHVSAEFHAETRDGDGKRQRSPQPLRVYDTNDGRWALRTRPHYGDEHLELIPASTSKVADLLDELRREVTSCV
jgi:hypothetical protein